MLSSDELVKEDILASSPELGLVSGTEPAWGALGQGHCGSFCAEASSSQGHLASLPPSWEDDLSQVGLVLSSGKSWSGPCVGLGPTETEPMPGLAFLVACCLLLITPFQFDSFASKTTWFPPPSPSPAPNRRVDLWQQWTRFCSEQRDGHSLTLRGTVFLKRWEKDAFLSRERHMIVLEWKLQKYAWSFKLNLRC